MHLIKIFILFLISINAYTQIAKVEMVRGTVLIKSSTMAETPLKINDSINQGDIIISKDKSFAKLVFTDKSQMNVGPNSEMAIAKFGGGEPGLVNVIKGQIRSQVTKDILKVGDQSKILIKTKSAAMGVRGTDLLVSFNPENGNTSLITFTGLVSMAKIDEKEYQSNLPSAFESIVSDKERAVAVSEGMFSGAIPSEDHATIPTKPSPSQMSNLQANVNFETKPVASTGPEKIYSSPIAPGLNPMVASNNNVKNLEADVKTQLSPAQLQDKAINLTATISAPPPEGAIDAKGNFAPPAGGIIDLKTAQYIAPPPGAAYDPNTKTFIVPSNFGSVDPSGNYKAPEGLKLTSEGRFEVIEKPLAPTTTSTAAPTGTAPTSATSTLAPLPTGILPQNTVLVGGGAVLPPPPTLAGGTYILPPPTAPIGPPPPINDVLGGGFFIPGNYFIDVNNTANANTQLNVITQTPVTVNLNSN